MKTDALSTTTDTHEHNWLQQLWRLVSAPIGDRSDRSLESVGSAAPTRSSQQTHSQDATSTRSPELAPPEAIIESQTLQAFSDYDEAYEPNDIAFAYLVPDELAQLNLPSEPAQVTSTGKASTENQSLVDTADELSAIANADSDEPLSDLIPLELSKLSKHQAA